MEKKQSILSIKSLLLVQLYRDESQGVTRPIEDYVFQFKVDIHVIVKALKSLASDGILTLTPDNQGPGHPMLTQRGTKLGEMSDDNELYLCDYALERLCDDDNDLYLCDSELKFIDLEEVDFELGEEYMERDEEVVAWGMERLIECGYIEGTESLGGQILASELTPRGRKLMVRSKLFVMDQYEDPTPLITNSFNVSGNNFNGQTSIGNPGTTNMADNRSFAQNNYETMIEQLREEGIEDLAESMESDDDTSEEGVVRKFRKWVTDSCSDFTKVATAVQIISACLGITLQ